MLKPMAEKLLRNPKKKERVWSELYGAWGFYKDVTPEDEFIFWSVIDIGDRVNLASFGFDAGEVGLVVDIDRAKDAKRRIKLLLNSCRMIELSIDEGRIFRLGWKFIV